MQLSFKPLLYVRLWTWLCAQRCGYKISCQPIHSCELLDVMVFFLGLDLWYMKQDLWVRMASVFM